MPDREPWVVLCEIERRRWGGDLRRARIFHELALRTGALEVQGWGHESVRSALRATVGLPFPWRRQPWVASSEFLSDGALEQLRRGARPAVLDVHDHPVAQAEALQVPLTPEARAAHQARYDRNVAAFPWWTAPSASFADLAGLDRSRVIVAPNGTDTAAIRPAPPPPTPAIGMISGAAPGRGVERLIDAARLLRPARPDLRLLLWLVAADDAGEAYLGGLRAGAPEPWIEIGPAPYGEVGSSLARASVLVVPHPPNAYMDVAVPVKLLDSMAAGRPVVVTPRLETRRIVEAAGAGLVAAGDGAEDLAAAIAAVLDDAAAAGRFGAAARVAAERDFDWRVIGGRVAAAVLERLAGDPSPIGAAPGR